MILEIKTEPSKTNIPSGNWQTEILEENGQSLLCYGDTGPLSYRRALAEYNRRAAQEYTQ